MALSRQRGDSWDPKWGTSQNLRFTSPAQAIEEARAATRRAVKASSSPFTPKRWAQTIEYSTTMMAGNAIPGLDVADAKAIEECRRAGRAAGHRVELLGQLQEEWLRPEEHVAPFEVDDAWDAAWGRCGRGWVWRAPRVAARADSAADTSSAVMPLRSEGVRPLIEA